MSAICHNGIILILEQVANENKKSRCLSWKGVAQPVLLVSAYSILRIQSNEEKELGY